MDKPSVLLVVSMPQIPFDTEGLRLWLIECGFDVRTIDMRWEPPCCAHCGLDVHHAYGRALELGIEWCDPVCCEVAL